jgi:hypothetical protein
VCIGQLARYSGSFIDLSNPDAVQDVASAALLTKAVSILQPAQRYSGSVIDLYAPDAALAVASALPAKPVFIRQPAPRYSGSVIDLWSAPDGALASASTSLAKLVFGQSSGVVKENRVLVDQNHALAIVVGQMKSREIEAAHKCRALEESRDRLSLDFNQLYLDYWSQRDVIDDLKAQLANNNADLISELQENITSLDFAWSAHLLVSLKRPTRYASAASWRARKAVLCIRKSDFMPQAISRTRRWKGAFLIKRSVFFWYLQISRRATVPGCQRWGFFTPPKDLARLRAAIVAR